MQLWRSSFTRARIWSQLIINEGLLGKPVVVGHRSCLQGLCCLLVHQRTMPVISPIVPCVCDMHNVITGHTQRWRVTVRLYVEINTHIEGVSTHKIRHWELGAQLGVCWGQDRDRGQLKQCLSEKIKMYYCVIQYIFYYVCYWESLNCFITCTSIWSWRRFAAHPTGFCISNIWFW